MKSLILITLISMLLSNEKEYLITDFENRNLEWRIVNDGVMGGLSQSCLDIHAGQATYSGSVSLENYGGFASVRTLFNEEVDEGLTRIKIRVRGDGKKYSFRLRKDNRFDGLAYKLDFNTKGKEWEEIILPIKDFVGTYRGRIFEEEQMLNPNLIGQLGILIADKQEGPFEIQIDWIKLIP